VALNRPEAPDIPSHPANDEFHLFIAARERLILDLVHAATGLPAERLQRDE
jgi:hypothetical protein